MDEEKIDIADNKTENSEKNTNKGKKSGILKFFNKVLKVIILIAIIVGVFVIGVKYSDLFVHKAYSQEIGFKNVGELVTQTAYLRILEDSSENRNLLEFLEKLSLPAPNIKAPFTESRKIFSYIIQVDASINFEEIVIEQIDDEEMIIYLKLPHAKIYQATPDYNSFESHLDSESLFSRIDSNEQNELFKDMITKATDQAIANGIIEKADDISILM